MTTASGRPPLRGAHEPGRALGQRPPRGCLAGRPRGVRARDRPLRSRVAWSVARGARQPERCRKSFGSRARAQRPGLPGRAAGSGRRRRRERLWQVDAAAAPGRRRGAGRGQRVARRGTSSRYLPQHPLGDERTPLETVARPARPGRARPRAAPRRRAARLAGARRRPRPHGARAAPAGGARRALGGRGRAEPGRAGARDAARRRHRRGRSSRCRPPRSPAASAS